MVSAPAGGAPDQAMQLLLRQRITCDFREAELVDVVDFLRRASGINMVFDPRLQADPITLTVNDMQMSSVLYWIETLSGCTISYINQAIYFLINSTSIVDP